MSNKRRLKFWTPLRTAELRRLWGAGQLAPQIAKALGTTRNTVGAKAARLGLRPLKPGPVSPTPAPKPKPPGVALDARPAAPKVHRPAIALTHGGAICPRRALNTPSASYTRCWLRPAPTPRGCSLYSPLHES